MGFREMCFLVEKELSCEAGPLHPPTHVLILLTVKIRKWRLIRRTTSVVLGGAMTLGLHGNNYGHVFFKYF